MKSWRAGDSRKAPRPRPSKRVYSGTVGATYGPPGTPMRRVALPASVIVILAVAIVSYRIAHQKIVVERPMLGGPPPEARHHEDLVGRPAPAFTTVDQQGH